MYRGFAVLALLTFAAFEVVEAKKLNHETKALRRRMGADWSTIAGNVKIRTGPSFKPEWMNLYTNSVVKMRELISKAKSDIDWAKAQLDQDPNALLPADLIFDVTFLFGCTNDRASLVAKISDLKTKLDTLSGDHCSGSGLRLSTIKEAGSTVQSVCNGANAMMVKGTYLLKYAHTHTHTHNSHTGIADKTKWANFFLSNAVMDMKYVYVNTEISQMASDANFIATTLAHELSHGCLSTTDDVKLPFPNVHETVRGFKSTMDFADAANMFRSVDQTNIAVSAYSWESFVQNSPGNYATTAAGLPKFLDVAAAYAGI